MAWLLISYIQLGATRWPDPDESCWYRNRLRVAFDGDADTHSMVPSSVMLQ